MTQIITERIKTFACQGIANVVWALAKFQFQQSLGLWQTGWVQREWVDVENISLFPLRFDQAEPVDWSADIHVECIEWSWQQDFVQMYPPFSTRRVAYLGCPLNCQQWWLVNAGGGQVKMQSTWCSLQLIQRLVQTQWSACYSLFIKLCHSSFATGMVALHAMCFITWRVIAKISQI